LNTRNAEKNTIIYSYLACLVRNLFCEYIQLEYVRVPIGASSVHIGFGWLVAVPLTLPFSSVAMRLGPVPAGPVHSCVGAAGRFAAVCCVRGGGGSEG